MCKGSGVKALGDAISTAAVTAILHATASSTTDTAANNATGRQLHNHYHFLRLQRSR